VKTQLGALLLVVSVAACVGGATPASSGSAALSRTTAIGPSAVQSALVPPDLRGAGSYAILAGSTITSTGFTSITGNVGLFPGSAVTGFPPGTLLGRFHVADPLAKRAKLDLERAYNDAMSRTRDLVAVAGNLGGRTLAPGLYKSTSSLAVSSGDLTLDGHGNVNAVFVFQAASSFTMTTGRRVVLTHGARARNVFWAVGSSATLGTECSFYGNLLVHQSISMATGSVIVGRALTQTGAVTLQSNTIKTPVR